MAHFKPKETRKPQASKLTGFKKNVDIKLAYRVTSKVKWVRQMNFVLGFRKVHDKSVCVLFSYYVVISKKLFWDST